MTAFGHVGCGTTLEVTVVQSRDLAEKLNSQRNFQATSEPIKPRSDAVLKQHHAEPENTKAANGNESLRRDGEVATEIQTSVAGTTSNIVSPAIHQG